MLSPEYWEPFEFVLEPGTLVYPISTSEKILPNDMIRSEASSCKWIRVSNRYTALVGSTMDGILREYGQMVITEAFREYI